MTPENAQTSPDAVLNQLTRLLQLSKLARQAESAEALQFLLVNQTHGLCPYALGTLWVANEGVVAQSGSPLVERNAPFIQWLNPVCEQLAGVTTAIRVTPDVLRPEDVHAWSDHLPAAAIWLPIVLKDQPATGLLLCRQEHWEDTDIALLEEWVDIWAHAWAKMHRASLHGELTTLWRKFHGWLPEKEAVKAEAAALKAGGHHVVNEVLRQPKSWPELLRAGWAQLCTTCRQVFTRVKAEGMAGTRQRIEAEAKAIWQNKRRRYTWLTVLVLLFPLRLTVLVPAELVPANPAIIRAPLEGVVDEFFVKPNQQVAEGQQLFRLDLTTLTSRLNVAEQETQVASSEYRQSSLQSLTDAKSRAQLVPQEGKAAQRRVEADYLQELVSKAQIKTPRAGIVLFDDPSEWIGKPVAAGEKVMVVSTDGDVEIEAWVPVSDAIVMPKDAPVVLYLNATPLSPVEGHMRYIGHEALQRPDGSYAYRLRATLDPGEAGPRVGLKGTARISGQYVPLAYMILRKPLGAARQFLGL